MRRNRYGFSLVELLIVIGIIVVLMGILIPVLWKARKSASNVSCVSNLRQFASLYLMYAQASDDWIPLGGTAREDLPDPHPQHPSPHRGDWNNFIWLRSFPGSAGGPLMASGQIKPSDCKFLYCPDAADSKITWDAFRDHYATANPLPQRTIKIGYVVRPEGTWRFIVQTGEPIGVRYAMKPLYAMRGKAILADDPLRSQFNHKLNGETAINVAYDDGSVETRAVRLPGVEAALDVDEPIPLSPDQGSPGGLGVFLSLDRRQGG
jgi:prepilin-type N-terminal cleavage/methylation domain-containing protein